MTTNERGKQEGVFKITEFRGAVFVAPINQITDPDNPKYTGLQFTRQGADEFSLGSLRDIMIREGWFNQSSSTKANKNEE